MMEKGRNSSVVQDSNEEDGCVILEGVDSSEE